MTLTDAATIVGYVVLLLLGVGVALFLLGLLLERRHRAHADAQERRDAPGDALARAYREETHQRRDGRPR